MAAFRKIWWADFTAAEFDKIDPMRTIAILPTAAIEQHGPHLPVGVDTFLNRGPLDAMAKRVPSSAVTAQCREIFRAWGMSPEHARVTAERLEYADLHGVDSHGIALLPLYARLRGEGHFNFRPQPQVLRETATKPR